MAQYKYQVKKGFKWTTKFRYIDPESQETKVEYKRGFATRREAKEYEENFIDALENMQIDVQNKTFRDVYDEYLSSHKREDMKESSLETKSSIFSKHILPTFGDVAINEITVDDIATWQKEIARKTSRTGKCFSPSYLHTIQSQFNSIINYARDKGYITLNPLVDIKNMGKKEARLVCWDHEEYERFAYQAMNYPQYYYAYEVLYWCGIRKGELLALTRNDIDLENHTISINKTFSRSHGVDRVTTPKTLQSIRVLSIPQFLCDEIQEYLNMFPRMSPEQRVFPIDKFELSKLFHRLAREAGLREITIHGLRHSHVSLLISRKYDVFEVSKRIGHKSVKTTMDIYGHLFTNVQKSMADDMDEMRGGISYVL